MTESNKNPKVLDCKASDNEYLHKDFHSALCYAVKYLDDNFGQQATGEYLQQFAKTFYAPLIAELKTHGLSALERHWQDVFSKEGGRFSMKYDNGTLILTVDECPAVSHINKNNMMFTERYCQTTVVVNETICNEAGFDCSCEYEPGKGKCIQKFWKRG